ncbi:hypothetical protein Adt_34110 [Abeliophyllum distichum]|uniref:Uncharacterized protein n=1 Tax=Abeliophyllum distichum TaxID=126358 RepID=A0ABD1QY61_9LAMI
MSGKQAEWLNWGLIPHPFLHPGLPWPGVNPHYHPASPRFNGLLFTRHYLQEASLRFNGLLFTHRYLQEASLRFNGLLFTHHYLQEASLKFNGLLSIHLFHQGVFNSHHNCRGIRGSISNHGFRHICGIHMVQPKVVTWTMKAPAVPLLKKVEEKLILD